MLELKSELSIYYPDSTVVEPRKINWKPRSLIVHGVRDLVREPLSPAEFLRRPMLSRGRYLVLGFDQTVGGFRKFYLSNCRDQYRPTTIRLAMYSPEGKIIEILDEYAPTRRARIMAMRVVSKFAQEDFGENRLGLYCDDLQLVG